MKKSQLLGAVCTYFSVIAATFIFSSPVYSIQYSLTPIGDLFGGEFYSHTSAINNQGQVSGTSRTAIGGIGQEAFIWSPSTGISGLGIPAGSDFTSTGTGALNNAGQVAGQIVTGTVHEAFLYDPVTGMHPLGDLVGGGFWSIAQGINDSGQIVGVGESDNGREAVLWDGLSKPQPLGYIGSWSNGIEESGARDINNNGQVVGISSSPNAGGTGENEAFIWDSINGMVGLGFLDGQPNSSAIAINDLGQVIGGLAFLMLFYGIQ